MIELPPLPGPVAHVHSDGGFCADRQIKSTEWPVYLNTADQLRAYARQSVEEALEAAAKVAEQHYTPGHTVAGPHFAARCAAAIRALKDKP